MKLCNRKEDKSLLGNESHLRCTPSSVTGYSCLSVIPKQNAKCILLSHGRTPGISFRHCLWITLETEFHAVTLTLIQGIQIHWEPFQPPIFVEIQRGTCPCVYATSVYLHNNTNSVFLLTRTHATNILIVLPCVAFEEWFFQCISITLCLTFAKQVFA